MTDPQKKQPRADKYQAKKTREAERNRAINREGREIGPPPDSRVNARYNPCRRSLRAFCETFLAHWFPLAWSADHRTAITRLETAILQGGRFAFAMPRGSGKTTLCQAAALWALLYGHRYFLLIVGSTAAAAQQILDAIKAELETNDLLAEDFAEVCHPITALEGISNRCKGQTIDGERTRIEWTKDQIVLPTVAGSPASGAILRVRGIMGAIRGTKIGQRRPDLVIIDDPQTDKSARSPIGNKSRAAVIDNVILKLAGPTKKIAVCMPCTCIQPGDIVDSYLDRAKHPAWHGERMKMLYAYPAKMKLWDEYYSLRCESLRTRGDGSLATSFYARNRRAMDAGSAVAWPERHNDDEMSGLQHAMNLFLEDPRSFKAECQNEPEKEQALDELRQITEEDLAKKLTLLPRGVVPRDATRLTAFIDVQAEMLFWIVVAWTDRFGGSIVAYGCWPRQARSVFTAAEPNPGLSKQFPRLERGARIYAALSQMIPLLLAKQWPIANSNATLTISLVLVDARFETDAVHDYISRSPFKALLRPSMGRAIGPKSRPMNTFEKKPGDVVGWNWRIDAKTRARDRYVTFDANRWKSFVAEAILAEPGSGGSLYLPGQRITEHPLLAIHLTSEHRVSTSGPYGAREEWTLRPGHRENHWLDGLVGAAVAASVSGLKYQAAVAAGEPAAATTKAKKRNFAAEQQRARERRAAARA